jgi:sulfur-oxidizing protein SoxX
MKRTKTNARGLLRLLVMAFSVAAAQACVTEPPGRGVHLPQGDAAKGREAYVALRCHACHEIEGFDPPTPIVAATRVTLGTQTARVKTYEDLATSIANPSHRLARGYPPDAIVRDGVSLMSLIRLNEVMTVQQLVDIVAFLQAEYGVAPPPIRPDDVYPSEDAGALSPAPAL